MIEYVVSYPYVVNPGHNKVAMVSKNRPPHLKGVLNLPGGKIEDGETVVQAAVRELYEETGLEELEVYDDSVYYPSEHYGTIECDDCVVHCVKVPVVYQELKPKQFETERVAWYDADDVLNHPALMPNLRLIMPLVRTGCKGWVIYDKGDGWRHNEQHEIELALANCRKVKVLLHGMAWFRDREL